MEIALVCGNDECSRREKAVNIALHGSLSKESPCISALGGMCIMKTAGMSYVSINFASYGGAREWMRALLGSTRLTEGSITIQQDQAYGNVHLLWNCSLM